MDGLTTQVDTFMTSHVRGGYKREEGKEWGTSSTYGEILSFMYTKTRCQEMSWPGEIEERRLEEGKESGKENGKFFQ